MDRLGSTLSCEIICATKSMVWDEMYFIVSFFVCVFVVCRYDGGLLGRRAVCQQFPGLDLARPLSHGPWFPVLGCQVLCYYRPSVVTTRHYPLYYLTIHHKSPPHLTTHHLTSSYITSHHHTSLPIISHHHTSQVTIAPHCPSSQVYHSSSQPPCPSPLMITSHR